ncbi:MAG: hypothetical protein IID46_14295, partial [Planctomycetes bacterium]|nr:hypothetical protein [Planctomycetota bacterium]
MKKFFIVLGSILVVSGWSDQLSAQTFESPAQTEVLQSAGGKSVPAVLSPKPSAVKKGAKKKTSSKSGAAKKKKGAAKKADAAPKTTQRPTKPDDPPNPKELELRPSDDGKMKLSFKGQPWPHLLEWLAKVSDMSLDWQELPADYLNLVSNRRYTVLEVQDLINRRLLSRGFTMLKNGDVLSVVNIKKLDPSMVPRVSPEELAQRNPHEFVRVSFRLNWLLAEQAVTEFEPMRSPNGKLTPLKETNRLEAMDAVVNLREIYRLIQEEQAGDGQKQLVKEFKLKHTRASKVLEQLRTLLGMDKSSKAAGPLTPQQIQAQQRAAMMARSQPGKKPAAGAAKPKAEVHLVVNVRENSILVNAPPDKMAIVEQAIQIIDVPADASHSLLRNLDRMRVYRLAALDPETLVKILEEVGSLDYDTKLEVDTKGKAVIAYASLADHLTIQSVVDRLDGSGRSFEVIQLRRLESDYVAGTIEAMMGGQEEKKKQSSYSRFYYNPYGSNNQQDDKTDKFRVSGDVEFNRLLLWANEIELREVENLLVKLGEIPARGGSPSTMRVIDVEPGEDTEELLKRLRKIWPSLGPNELLLDAPSESKEKEKRTQNAKPQKQPNLLKSTQSTDRSIPRKNIESAEIISVVLNDDAEKNVEVAQKDSTETPQKTQPRIVNEEGNLVNPNSRNPYFLRNNRRPTPGMTPPPISITRTP